MANGVFFPHVNVPTRRKDQVQENLNAHGLNRRSILHPITLEYEGASWQQTPPHQPVVTS
jgi:hypothetical protein